MPYKLHDASSTVCLSPSPLSSLGDLIAAQNAKLEALKTHKKGLMQQLFPAPEGVEG